MKKSGISRVGDSLIELILPGRCGLCGDLCKDPFCTSCGELLPWQSAGCRRCGSAPGGSGGYDCGQCLLSPPPFVQTITAFRYAPPIPGLIHRFKYRQALHYVDTLGEVLAEVVCKNLSAPLDILVPVPLHPRRMSARGFNQSAELAKKLSAQLATARDLDSLKRIRDTPNQTGLDAASRARNVRGAFVCRSAALTGRRVGLVDDVVTSGSTVRAACHALKSAHVKSVTVIALAKTEETLIRQNPH